MNILYTRKKKYYYIIILILGFTSGFWNVSDVLAQAGKDGAVTVSVANTVVNSYASITPSTNATGTGSYTATLSSGTTTIYHTTLAPVATFAVGDLVLIVQMQGGGLTMDQTTTASSYGNVSAYGNVGLYEFRVVSAVNSANQITLTQGLTNTYTNTNNTGAGNNNRAQIVKIPRYTTLIINSGASVVASAWDGARGGIVAVEANNSINLNGTINVSGQGFRGGVYENATTAVTANVPNYAYSTDASGATKGESIAGSTTFTGSSLTSNLVITGTLPGGNIFGRGAPANGGGGGNAHNAGGGGGANANNGNTWNGQGVMCSTCTGSGAWALDPGYIANSNARTNNSGGGRGGYTYSGTNLNALSDGPNNSSWMGDSRQERGGLGGRPMNTSVNLPQNRVFFGGGGGAGDGNNGAGTSGANGGGIVFILANAVSGSGSILANGSNATDAAGVDAPGGGGGGGTIVVKATSFSTVSMAANGGNGGNQILNSAEAEGPGGGGGGGYIAYSGGATSALTSVISGSNGTTNSTALTEFPANGATSGASGQISDISTASLPYATTNTAPVIAANPYSATTNALDGGSTATISMEENNVAVITVEAFDADPQNTITYSITGGADAARFSINASTGVLTFNAVPDFEAPIDADANNSYLVTVRATDNVGLFDEQALTVNITNTTAAPSAGKNWASKKPTVASSVFSGGTRSSLAVDGSSSFGYYWSSAYADNQWLYTDLGTTLSVSTIRVNWTNGEHASNYQLQVSNDATNWTTVQTVTNNTTSAVVQEYDITPTSARYVRVLGTTRGSTKGFALNEISVSGTPSNTNPTITSNGAGSTASVSVAENSTAVTTVTSGDDEAHAVTYSIVGGADQTKFSINSSTGALTFVTAPNFESPSDVGANNIYDVTVRATDNGTGTLFDEQAIAVTVTNVNEAPVISSNGGGATASVSVAENTTTVTTVTATDVDANTTITYSIVGGADQTKFSINQSTGALTFTSAPNFEAPTDADANNTYIVIVRATDNGTGALNDEQTITATVTNINESLVLVNNSALTINEGATGTITSSLLQYSDPELGTITYTVTTAALNGTLFGDANSNNTADVGETLALNSTFTQADINSGSLRYTHNSSETTSGNFGFSVSDGTNSITGRTFTTNVTPVNDSPSSPTDANAATNTIPENSANGTSVGITASSTDAEGTTVIYSLTDNAGGRFTINSSTGVVTVANGTLLNFESATSHNITVQASDGTASSTQTFTIAVTNVNEAPVITSNGGDATASVSVAENTTTVTTVTATDVDASTTITYSIVGGTDQTKFTINANTGALTFTSAPNFESPTDADANNTYIVTVRATDNGSPSTLNDEQTITVTVTNVNETLTQVNNSALTINEGATGTITSSLLQYTDPESGTITYTVTTAAINGTLFKDANSNNVADVGETLVLNSTFTQTDINNSLLKYTHNSSETTSGNFGFSVSDGTNSITGRTFTTNVTPVNDPPVITSNGGGSTAGISVAENTTAVTTVTATDAESNSITYSIVSGPDQGKFTINAASGVLTFTTAPNFESPTDADINNTYIVTVRATDNGTGALTDEQTITVTVTNANDAPVASTITVATSIPNTAVKKAIDNLSATDQDAGNTIASFRITSLPTSGTLYINNVEVTNGNLSTVYTATSNQLSNLTYTPASGFTGNATFTYTATDSNNPSATSAPATYTIPVNADTKATYAYQSVYSKFALTNGTTAATASDADGTIVSASVTGTALPAFLTLNANGNIVVNSNTVVEGTYNTIITLTDNKGGISSNVAVTLVINSDIYQPNGDAIKLADNCYQLTPDSGDKRGQVWRTSPITLASSFEISFNAFLGNKDNGADGIAFGFQRSTNSLFAVGAPGEGMGFGHGASASNPRSGGISPSVAVEFDTFQNGQSSEIAADHIAIFKNGEERAPVKTPVQMSSTSTNTEDNTYHPVKIIWKKSSNTLYVYFDGVLRESYSEDFVNTVFSGNPSVYFGYTASTGGATNQQSVCEISYNPMDNDSDGVADVEDLDDDNDGIPDLLESGNIDPSADADDDGLPNFRDPVPGGSIAWADTNNDGINDNFDKDKDGIMNAFDLDSDGDGITDVVEQAPKGLVPASNYDSNTGRLTSSVNSNGIPSSSLTTTEASLNDYDSDGLKNFLDIDADNDGLLDNMEAQGLTAQGSSPIAKSGTDTDKDGIDNSYDTTNGGTALSPVKTNPSVDALPDYLNLDSDADAFRDAEEGYDTNNNGQSYDDLMSLASSFRSNANAAGNSAAAAYYSTTDTDKDGQPDWMEDSDGNGVMNFLQFNNAFYRDSDSDGFVDLFDSDSFGPSSSPTPNSSFRDSGDLTTLPVTLVSFTATLVQDKVRLNWRTATEKDNDFFDVERSNDGKQFFKIGRVKGSGSTVQSQNYMLIDVKPLAGHNYYRLKQTDFNGKFEYSAIIGVNTQNSVKNQLVIYPNPTTEDATLQLNLAVSETVTVEVSDMAGKQLFSKTITGMAGQSETQLDLKQLSQGTYLVVVKGKHINLVQRVVKN